MQIVVDEGGSVEFTRKPHLLELLHENDRKRIERMTDIRFDDIIQRFYIVFLQGPPGIAARQLRATDKPFRWTEFVADYCGGSVPYDYGLDGTNIVWFRTYEDAVKVEVDYVEFLRDLGYSMK